jgi:ATP-dependent Lon protease
VVLPKENEKDMVEVPEVVKSGLEFIFVSNLDDVFANALT